MTDRELLEEILKMLQKINEIIMPTIKCVHGIPFERGCMLCSSSAPYNHMHVYCAECKNDPNKN